MKNLGFILCLIIMTAAASAQPSLDIKRVQLAWPMVEISFTAGCDGNAVGGLLPQDVSLTEDGIPVSQFDLSCSTVGGVCRASVALLFDASGSMVGSGNAGAKLGGHAFIDRMRDNIDEAAVLFFTQVVSLEQSMTKNKALLHSAVDRLPASGATAMWDGIYAAINEVASNGTGDARAVIALSDGTDNSSSKLVTEVIALASQHGVRVYTVLLGTSGSNELELIAQSTGGEFVQTPNAGQLQSIYEGFADQMTHCFQECTLSYESSCADGGTRMLDLTVNNLCGKSATASGSFTAPRDSTDRQPLPLYLSSSHTMGRREFTVQLNLPQALQQNHLYPSMLRLHYDDQSLILKKVDVPAVSLMHGVQWTHQEMPGLVQVQTFTPAALNGTGPLLELTFEARDVQDTICSEIGLTSWVTPYGCLVPEVAPGEICVYPWKDEPLVFCDISPEIALEWRTSRRGYVPDPVTVSARFDNNGAATARSGRFIVDYDHSALRRIQPAQDTVIYAIPDIIAGSHTAVAWDFEALPRADAGVAQVCITGQFDNHPDVYCCTNILIPASGPVLACDITIPPIVANPNRGEYEPMPFPVSVRIRNTGETDTDTVRVRLIVPPDLALLPGEVEEKMAQPAVLGGAESATIVWMLTHATTAVKRQYLVEAWSRCANADSSRCETVVNIPALNVLDFRVQLQHTGALELCEGESVTLDAGKDHDSLRWNTGDTTQKIAVRQSGTYYCVLALGARTGYSDTVTVLVHPRPRPVLTASGSVPLCPGDTVILDAGAGYVRYNWSNMLVQRRIPVTRAGTYYADVTDVNGCPGRSDTVVVTMNSAVPIPVITRSGDMLSTASAAGWQWYRNGQPVAGGDVQSIQLNETGRYSVRITDANGCSALSDEINVAVLDAHALPAVVRSFDVYPDPTVGGVTVDLRLARAELISVVVTNALGQELSRIDSGHLVRDFSRHLSLGTSPGAYFLRITAGADTWVRRVVKMQ
ncbi:MAG: VWA domain-containing protein [Bacteroidota bacterium]